MAVVTVALPVMCSQDAEDAKSGAWGGAAAEILRMTEAKREEWVMIGRVESVAVSHHATPQDLPSRGKP